MLYESLRHRNIPALCRAASRANSMALGGCVLRGGYIGYPRAVCMACRLYHSTRNHFFIAVFTAYITGISVIGAGWRFGVFKPAEDMTFGFNFTAFRQQFVAIFTILITGIPFLGTGGGFRVFGCAGAMPGLFNNFTLAHLLAAYFADFITRISVLCASGTLRAFNVSLAGMDFRNTVNRGRQTLIYRNFKGQNRTLI